MRVQSPYLLATRTWIAAIPGKPPFRFVYSDKLPCPIIDGSSKILPLQEFLIPCVLWIYLECIHFPKISSVAELSSVYCCLVVFSKSKKKFWQNLAQVYVETGRHSFQS